MSMSCADAGSEPVRRFEVFTGAGRRREWSDEAAVYVFRAKRADWIKLAFWDGTGVVLVAKRLEDGEFRWPKAEDSVMQLFGDVALGAAGRPRLAAGS